MTKGCDLKGIERWVYDQMHVGIIMADENLNLLFINSWVENYLNLEMEKVCRVNLYEVFPNLKKKNIPGNIEMALQGQVSVLSNKFHKYILPIPLMPGEYGKLDFMQQVTTISPRMNDETVAGVMIVIEDVTDRVFHEMDFSQQIEELELLQKSLLQSGKILKESNELNQSMLTTIPFGMDIVDEHGNILFQSENLKWLFGEESTIKKCWELYCDDKKQCADCPLRKEIVLGRTEIYIAYNVMGGRTFEVTHTGMMFKGEKALLEIFIDITDRKAAEEKIQQQNLELQQINAEKDKFFSIIAHDLRGPFNGFLGLTEIMTKELPSLTVQEVQDIAVRLNKSATNLYGLLNNLLEWSQIQKGEFPFKPEAIQLGLVIGESIDMMHESAKNKAIEIALDIPEGLVAFADTNMLQTILRNLVSNAIKFTPKGGKVSVSVKMVTDNRVEISIQDTGIGMNQTIIENLFSIDVKTNRKGTEGEPSTGLGLLLCKEFVEKHGGRIWAESEVGVGTTFSFTLKNQ